MTPPYRRTAGMTLVELMITVAILSVIVAIALPAYNGYIREGHFTTIRATMNGMRTAVEDYRLDNGNYGATGATYEQSSGKTEIEAQFGWIPSGDISAYTYTLVVESTNSYDVYGQFDPVPGRAATTAIKRAAIPTPPAATARSPAPDPSESGADSVHSLPRMH